MATNLAARDGASGVSEEKEVIRIIKDGERAALETSNQHREERTEKKREGEGAGRGGENLNGTGGRELGIGPEMSRPG